MAQDPQSLLNNSDVQCYNCFYAPWLLKLALLRQILLAQNPMADASPQGLLNNADVQCYECFGMPWLLELALLRQIAVNGAGGSGNKTTVAATDPVGNGTTAGDLWINELSAQMWYWSGSAWNPIIGP